MYRDDQEAAIERAEALEAELAAAKRALAEAHDEIETLQRKLAALEQEREVLTASLARLGAEVPRSEGDDTPLPRYDLNKRRSTGLLWIVLFVSSVFLLRYLSDCDAQKHAREWDRIEQQRRLQERHELDRSGRPLAPVQCPPAPRGVDEIAAPGSVTLFGEMHGTTEVATLVADIACRVSATHAVIIGLELPSSMNDLLRDYLGSDGGDAAKQQLLADPFWTFGDGRGSVAVLGLIERARLLHRAGRSVSLFGFDVTFVPGGDEAARDEGMATEIVDRLHQPDAAEAVALIVTGNLHARTDTARWMGWHIRKALPGLRSLDIAYSGGDAWFCTETGCGPSELRGEDRGTERFVELEVSSDRPGFDGIYYLGRVSASAPAGTDPGKERAP